MHHDARGFGFAVGSLARGRACQQARRQQARRQQARSRPRRSPRPVPRAQRHGFWPRSGAYRRLRACGGARPREARRGHPWLGARDRGTHTRAAGLPAWFVGLRDPGRSGRQAQGPRRRGFPDDGPVVRLRLRHRQLRGRRVEPPHRAGGSCRDERSRSSSWRARAGASHARGIHPGSRVSYRTGRQWTAKAFRPCQAAGCGFDGSGRFYSRGFRRIYQRRRAGLPGRRASGGHSGNPEGGYSIPGNASTGADTAGGEFALDNVDAFLATEGQARLLAVSRPQELSPVKSLADVERFERDAALVCGDWALVPAR